MSALVVVVAYSLLAQSGDRYGTTPASPARGNTGFTYGAVSDAGADTSGRFAPGTAQAPLPAGRLGATTANTAAGDTRTQLPSGQRPLAPSRAATASAQYQPSRVAQSSVTPVGADAASAGYQPARLMRAMLSPPPGSRLTGQAVGLAEVVGGATTRAEQSERIDAYWDICSAVADYYLSLREWEDYQQASPKVSSANTAWQQFGGVLNGRVNTSWQAAVASQQRLAALMQNPTARSLPLPRDLPHCGAYLTHHEEIFQGRYSAEAEQLNRLLPLRYQELQTAADMVKDDEGFLRTVLASSSPDYAEGVIKALKVLALQRRAFVQIAKDYNRRIAHYSELASPGHLETARLVRILIHQPGATSTATRPASTATRTDIPPAPSGRYGPQSQANPFGAPPTFADDVQWAPRSGESSPEAMRDDFVVPTSGSAPNYEELGEERSVLVPGP